MEEMELSPDQTEKILQFQDLTGIENLSICRDSLQRHNWDLEVAVQDQLNISEGRPSVYASENAPPPVVSDVVTQHVFYSPPSGSYRWGGPIGYLVSFVFQFCYNTLSSILKFAYSIIWKEQRRAVTDPIGDVLKFVNYFNDNISHNHPVFYQGSYSQALNDAKQELKFLMVYLNEEGNQDCLNFCRDCLTDEQTINFVNTHTLFWACDAKTGEGERVANLIKASSYPFLAVIVPKDARMTLVARMEGPTNSEELRCRLRAIISANANYIEVARSDRIARSLNQRIRQEQDLAYLESLRADQEKERLKNEVQMRKQAEELKELEQKRQEQLRKEEIQNEKIMKASDVPDEPDSNHPEALSVVFKMPSGERVERRFLKTDSLLDIYNFVFCHPSSPDNFEIAMNFPKRTLQCCTESEKTLIEAGLGGREVLFVYDLEA